MEIFFKIKAWLSYELKAHYRRGHHIHSPYTYRLVSNVLFEKWPYYSFLRIEELRKKLLAENEENPADRSKYTQLLQRLCATNNSKTIMEIGRSNGISTMYLASNNTQSTVYSISNNKNTDVFKHCNFLNIQQRKESELQKVLDEIKCLDMLYVRRSCGIIDIDSIFDLCKTKAQDESIFIFDNIHSDRQTEQRWNNILKSNNVTLSIDLFWIGLIWFKKDMKRQHYIIKY